MHVGCIFRRISAFDFLFKGALSTDKMSATLEAIKYSRGSLELLDQRKLPTQTIYLPVPDTKAAWCALAVIVSCYYLKSR